MYPLGKLLLAERGNTAHHPCPAADALTIPQHPHGRGEMVGPRRIKRLNTLFDTAG